MAGPLFTTGGAEVDQTYLQNWPASLRQTLGATFDEGIATSWPSRLGELIDRSPRRSDPNVDSPVIDAETARARVKEQNLDLEIPDSGLKEYVLDRMIDRKYAEKLRRSVMERGPDDGWSMAARFGTGVAASLLDPVNIAAAFIPVVGPARYGAMLRGAASGLGRTAVRARVGATEGLVGNLAIEPFSYGLSKQLQDDYTWRDSLLNIAFGTVLGGGLHMGIGAVGDATAKGLPWWAAKPEGDVAKALAAMDPTTRENLLKTAVAQAAEGRPVNVEPVVREALWERVQRQVEAERAVAEAWSTPGFQRTADDLLTLKAGIPAREADPIVSRGTDLSETPGFLRTKEEAKFMRDLEMGRLDPRPDAYAAARDNHAPTAAREAEVTAADETLASVAKAEPSGHVDDTRVTAEHSIALQERALVDEQAKQMGLDLTKEFEAIAQPVKDAGRFANVMRALAACQLRS